MSKAPKDLFQYVVRVSPKAKNLRLKVTVKDGLEVIAPKGYDQTKVPAVVDRKKHWIAAALERMETNRKFLEPEPEWQLPTSILLPAIGQRWHVESRESDTKTVTVREIGPERVLIFGNVEDEKACVAALRRWIMRLARNSLVPILEKVSEKAGLRYSRVFIKRQRTRWASCSRNRAISLNAKLLFLEPDLVEYCMTHELCHLAEMNHSRNFWALVACHSTDYRLLDRRPRDAWRSLPKWV